MKRLFLTSLALLLVMGSLGHVFAAAFCPGMLSRDCCLKEASSPQHCSQTHQNMHGMPMDGILDETMTMDGSDMHGMMMDEAAVPAPSLDLKEVTLVSTSEEVLQANQLDLPVEDCTHCMSHSGVPNAPVSSVTVPDQSSKDPGSIPLPISKFLLRPAMTLAQIGIPREHAPPGSSAPRHLLISVFLI